MSLIRCVVALSLAASLSSTFAQANELVVYSSRQEHLIQPVQQMLKKLPECFGKIIRLFLGN